jgi:1,4-dihydroxy-6-naphthoate synthase
MNCPLPLAAIAIRRDLAGAHAATMDRALRASVEYAFAHPDASREYVREHAQEMDPAVAAKHIQLYVNDYTLAFDERAVYALLDWQQELGLGSTARSLPIFV